MGTFWHRKFWARDILEPEHFGTWIFWHLAKQYGTDILGPVVLCQNVPVPKIPSYQKVPMMKCFRFEISGCRNIHSAEWCTFRNVPAMKHLC